MIEVVGEMGDINKIEIGLEARKGLRRDTKDQADVEWRPEAVTVAHVSSGQSWTFACNRRDVISRKRSKLLLSLPKEMVKQTASMRRSAGGGGSGGGGTEKVYEVIIGTSYAF